MMTTIADHARSMTLAQLEREIACAVSCGADDDYIAQMRSVFEQRRAIGERETLPAPKSDPENEEVR